MIHVYTLNSLLRLFHRRQRTDFLDTSIIFGWLEIRSKHRPPEEKQRSNRHTPLGPLSGVHVSRSAQWSVSRERGLGEENKDKGPE